MRELPGNLALGRTEQGIQFKGGYQVVGGFKTAGGGSKYQFALGDDQFTPILISQATGRVVVFPWEHLLKLAQQRGIEGFKCGVCGGEGITQEDGSPPPRWEFLGGVWVCWGCLAKSGALEPEGEASEHDPPDLPH